MCYLDVEKFIDINNYPGSVEEQKCHNNADKYNYKTETGLCFSLPQQNQKKINFLHQIPPGAKPLGLNDKC